MSGQQNKGPLKPRKQGPVELVFTVVIGLFFVAIFSWFTGMAIEVLGMNVGLMWKDQGERHAMEMVQQDLGYISAAPRSLLIDDTVAFSEGVVRWVQTPYEKLGLLTWYRRMHASADSASSTLSVPVAATPNGVLSNLTNTSKSIGKMLSTLAVVSMFVAQDVLLRMSVAIFALPAFVLACLIGVVDGLVRRDLRRWGGGRESSFVYHHAKAYTKWALTGGLGLYLAWPFGGFNPAYMVLVFTVLVAFTLSTTVASFKKYV